MYGEFALRVLGDLGPDASSARAGSALVGSLLATVTITELLDIQ